MNTFSLTPLLRSTVGFERFNDLFETLASGEELSAGYPPYNIEKQGEDRYGITMAVAGFTEKDLNVTTAHDSLTITGRIENRNEEGIEFLHRGIAMRPFERVFRLADYMKVTGAEMKDGLLRVHFVREIPEEQKPRTIQINTANAQKVIEHTSSNDNSTKKKAA